MRVRRRRFEIGRNIVGPDVVDNRLWWVRRALAFVRPNDPVAGRNVATALQRAGLTQHRSARAADLSRATVHRIEAGAGDPKLSTVTSLATALGAAL